MPIYEYVCSSKKCQHVFTELAKFDDKIKCPKCKKATEKQVSTTYHPVFVHRGKFRKRK